MFCRGCGKVPATEPQPKLKLELIGLELPFPFCGPCSEHFERLGTPTPVPFECDDEWRAIQVPDTHCAVTLSVGGWLRGLTTCSLCHKKHLPSISKTVQKVLPCPYPDKLFSGFPATLDLSSPLCPPCHDHLRVRLLHEQLRAFVTVLSTPMFGEGHKIVDPWGVLRSCVNVVLYTGWGAITGLGRSVAYGAVVGAAAGSVVGYHVGAIAHSATTKAITYFTRTSNAIIPYVSPSEFMDKIVGEFQIHQKEAANGASELKPHGTEPPVAVVNGEEKEADESDFTTGEEEHKVPAEPHGTDLSSNESTAEQEDPEPSSTGQSFTSKGSQSLDLEHARVLDCQNAYEVLELHPTATQAQIRRMYLQKAKVFHPDKNPHPKAHALFQEFQHAYNLIGTPSRRAEYHASGLRDPEEVGARGVMVVQPRSWVAMTTGFLGLMGGTALGAAGGLYIGFWLDMPLGAIMGMAEGVGWVHHSITTGASRNKLDEDNEAARKKVVTALQNNIRAASGIRIFSPRYGPYVSFREEDNDSQGFERKDGEIVGNDVKREGVQSSSTSKQSTQELTWYRGCIYEIHWYVSGKLPPIHLPREESEADGGKENETETALEDEMNRTSQSRIIVEAYGGIRDDYHTIAEVNEKVSKINFLVPFDWTYDSIRFRVRRANNPACFQLSDWVSLVPPPIEIAVPERVSLGVPFDVHVCCATALKHPLALTLSCSSWMKSIKLGETCLNCSSESTVGHEASASESQQSLPKPSSIVVLWEKAEHRDDNWYIHATLSLGFDISTQNAKPVNRITVAGTGVEQCVSTTSNYFVITN